MIKESYIDDVLDAIKKFYLNDRDLITRITHELTIAFRIAKYLSESLENEGFKIDFEFHGRIKDNIDQRKTSNGERIRPDIIFHKRTKVGQDEINLFLIEVKKESPNGDVEKARKTMKELDYRQAFCLSNVGKNYVTLYEINPGKENIKHRYKVQLNEETGFSLEEVNQ